MRIDNPFHEGEIQVQERAGEFDEGARNGRVLADSIMKGALKFVAQQPMVVLGSVDDAQGVWASVLFGPAGFVTAPGERRVDFDLSRAGLNEFDLVPRPKPPPKRAAATLKSNRSDLEAT